MRFKKSFPLFPSAVRCRHICKLALLIGAILACGLLDGAVAQVEWKGDDYHRSPNPKEKTVETKTVRSGRPAKLSKDEARIQPVDEAIGAGNKARDTNDYQQALIQYEKAKSLNPNDARSYYGLGNVYTDIYCSDSAVDAYLKALKLKPDYLEAVVGLGNAYSSKERFDDAQKQFEAAINLKRDNVEANLGLGRIHIVKGKYAEAITQLDLVINLPGLNENDRAAALVALGDVYWKQDKRDEAIAQFERAIRIKPNFAPAYIELGNARTNNAFAHVGSFTNPQEIDTQDLEKMRALAKEGANSLEDARKYDYNHPNLDEYVALALAYQLRFADATNRIDNYFAEVKRLEDQVSLSAAKCDAGFNRLRAEGYWYLADINYLRWMFETNEYQKPELLKKAIEYFNESLKLKHDLAASHEMLALIYTSQNNFQEAIQRTNDAIIYAVEESRKARLYLNLAITYNSLGRSEEALNSAQEAIRRNPFDAYLYRGLASIYISERKLDEALAEIKKADQLNPAQSGHDPHLLYQLGVAYGIRFINARNESDFVEAVKILKTLLEAKPRFTLAYQVLGGLYLIHNNANEAIENYEQAAKLNPKDPGNYLNIGRVYSELKNNDTAAIAQFKKAIEVKPDFADAYRRLGLVYQHQKDSDSAAKQLLKAIELQPDSIPAYMDLAEIYRTQKKYAEAIKYLNEVIGMAPKKAEAYQLLGAVYLEQLNADDAISNFNKAIEYDPKDPESYAGIGRVYAEINHDDETAIKYFVKAIEARPKYMALYSYLTDIYKRQKKYSEAIKLLTDAIKINPDSPWPYKDLGKIYEGQGNNTEALQYYNGAISRLSPNDEMTKTLYLGRVQRLQGNFRQAIELFRKVSFADEHGRSEFEIGATYVAAKDKKAARAQLNQLRTLNESLANDLARQINEMK